MLPEIKFTNEELTDIRNSYLNGESSVKIGKRYNTTHKPILKALKRMGVKIDQKRFVRKYSLDENYFDVIDTPNKAYILGLLYADGSNCSSKSTITISLQEEDKELLEKIRMELNSEKPLEYLDYSNKHSGGYHYKNQYRLLFFSSHLCEQLNDKGMVPNKSLILTVPTLRNDLYSHFVRGYFDGDGSFCFRYTQDNKARYLTTITSTQSFCEQIRQIIKDNVNIPCGNVYDASCHNGVTKVLSISGMKQNNALFKWLYADAELYLERKYRKISAVYENINDSLTA